MCTNLSQKIARPLVNAVLILIWAAVICQTSSAGETRVAGNLFSGITMSDVIATKDGRTDASTSGETSILGVESLSKVMTAASIKHDVRARAISVPVSQTEVDAEIELTVNVEGKRINLQMPLRDLSDSDRSDNELSGSDPIDDGDLMKLLVMCSKHPMIHLVADENQLSIQTWTGNQRVTETMLRDSLKRLKKASDAMAAILSQKDSPSTASTAASTEPVAQSKPSVAATSLKSNAGRSIAGTWSAQTSQSDAWAIRLDRSGTYTLVHTHGNQNSISKGTYSFTSTQLTLTESNGTTLSGKLSIPSASQFNWSLQNTKGTVTKTLQFKISQ